MQTIAKHIEKEITHYLDLLNIQQKEVVLSIVKTFAEKEDTWQDDKAYMAEMNKRFKDMENGNVETITLEELETGARQAYKTRKRRK